MVHKDIFETFKKLFPIYAEGVTEWFPNGKGSIRVRLGALHQEFIFTIHSNKEWRFETMENFIKNSMKRKGE